MNKNSFAKELAKRLNCTDITAKAFVKAYNHLIIEKIAEGQIVKLQYFGTFSPNKQVERLGRNPQNGEICKIAQRTTIKFKPSECTLKDLNKE